MSEPQNRPQTVEEAWRRLFDEIVRVLRVDKLADWLARKLPDELPRWLRWLDCIPDWKIVWAWYAGIYFVVGLAVIIAYLAGWHP